MGVDFFLFGGDGNWLGVGDDFLVINLDLGISFNFIGWLLGLIFCFVVFCVWVFFWVLGSFFVVVVYDNSVVSDVFSVVLLFFWVDGDMKFGLFLWIFVCVCWEKDGFVKLLWGWGGIVELDEWFWCGMCFCGWEKVFGCGLNMGWLGGFCFSVVVLLLLLELLLLFCLWFVFFLFLCGIFFVEFVNNWFFLFLFLLYFFWLFVLVL